MHTTKSHRGGHVAQRTFVQPEDYLHPILRLCEHNEMCVLPFLYDFSCMSSHFRILGT